MSVASHSMVARIHSYHQAAMPQRENACAAFSIACLLRGMGFHSWEGHEIGQDLVAYLAGMVALDDSYPLDADPGTALQSRWGFKRSYGFRLDRTLDPTTVGTSPEGMVQAVETLTEGLLTAVPVAGRRADGEPFSGTDLLALVEVVLRDDWAWPAQLVFNYQTSHLASLEGPGGGWADLLFGAPTQPCKWDVGHVTSFAGLLSCNDGGRAILLRDSSPLFGWQGYHPERPESIARALARSDGSQGGLLVLCSASDYEVASAAVAAAMPMANVSLWDNGSRYRPPDPLLPAPHRLAAAPPLAPPNSME